MADELSAEMIAELRAGLKAAHDFLRRKGREILGDDAYFDIDLRASNPGPFILACIDRNLAAARAHIDDRLAGLDAASARTHDEIAMVVVCRTRDVGIFDLMVDHGFDLDLVRANNAAPLRHACAYGRLGIVKKMISMGITLADVRVNDNEALREAAADGHHEVVDLLAEFGLGPADMQSMNGDARARASAHGLVDCVESLLRHGAEPTPEALRLLRARRGRIPPNVIARWVGTRELAWAEGPDAYDRWASARDADMAA